MTTWNDPVIRIWNAETGALEGELRDSTESVTQIALTSDGKTLASGSEDGAARLWDLATRQCRRVLKVREGSCLAVAFSPDGKLLATGYYDRTVRIWKCSDGTTALAGRLRDAMHDVCFLPVHMDAGYANGAPVDEGVLVADSGGAIRVWKVPREFGPPPSTTGLAAFSSILSGQSDGSIARWQRHVGAIHRVAVDRAGNTVASAGNDGTVSLTDLRSAVEGPQANWEVPWLASQFRFGPNDELMWTDRATRGTGYSPAGNANIANLETGRREHWGKYAAWGISGITLTPDGTELLLGHEQGKITIHPRNRTHPGNTWDFNAKGYVEQLDFTPDGRTLIVRFEGNPGELRLYDYATRKRLDRYPGRLVGEPSVLSRTGRWVVSRGDRVGYVWDLRSPAFSIHEFAYANRILALAVSPDERQFASGGDDRKIALRSLPTGAVQKELIGHEAFVTSLAFSPDGRTLLSGDLAGTVKVWSVRTGRFLFDLSHRVRKSERIEFSPSGRYLAFSAYMGPILVYDLQGLKGGD